MEYQKGGFPRGKMCFLALLLLYSTTIFSHIEAQHCDKRSGEVTISVQPRTQLFFAGGGAVAVLTCKKTTGKILSAAWYFEGKPIQPDFLKYHVTTSSTESKLIVSLNQSSDAGQYDCRINNKVCNGLIRRLDVAGTSEILTLSKKDHLACHVDEQATFRLTVLFLGSISLSWAFNGVLLEEHFTVEAVYHQKEFNFTIPNVSETDEGVYTATLKSLADISISSVVSKNFTLAVKRRPSPPEQFFCWPLSGTAVFLMMASTPAGPNHDEVLTYDLNISTPQGFKRNEILRAMNATSLDGVVQLQVKAVLSLVPCTKYQFSAQSVGHVLRSEPVSIECTTILPVLTANSFIKSRDVVYFCLNGECLPVCLSQCGLDLFLDHKCQVCSSARALNNVSVAYDGDYVFEISLQDVNQSWEFNDMISRCPQKIKAEECPSTHVMDMKILCNKDSDPTVASKSPT
eukprot:m.306322 g.306322  ORF g.306322 m.306322 type:complete len:459 (+) comp41149_c0_seq1:304-1680(+)